MKELKPMTYDGPVSVAVGRSRMDTAWKNTTIDWATFIKKIATPHRTHETFAEYKEMPKQQRDEIKDIGGFVGGTLQGGRRKAENVRWRSLITLDADYAKRIVDRPDFACAMYTTHSHSPEAPRFRLIIPLKRAVTPEEYPAVARKVAERFDIEIFDPTTYEIHRLMYWPSVSADGEFRSWYVDGPWIDPDEILAEYEDWRNPLEWPTSSREAKARTREAKRQGDPLEKKGWVGAFCRTYDVESAIEIFLSDVYEKHADNRYTYREGSTTGGLVIYDDGRFAYSFHATDPAGGKLLNSFDLVRVHLFGDLDDDAEPGTPTNRLPSYQAMLDFARKDEETKKTMGLDQIEEAREDFEGEEWLSKLELNEKTGKLKLTFRNFELILENDPELKGCFGYDEFNGRVAIMQPTPWGKEEGIFDNTDDAALRGWIENKYGIRHKERLADALAVVAAKNSFHPVRDYLDSLEWDGKKRLESVFIDFLGVEDNEHIRLLTKKALVAAVKRVYEPGCKFDEMVVLIGPQGIGKSQIIYRLSKGWFTDSLDSLNGKDAYENIQGVWLVELAELSAIRRSADVEAVKKFLSKQVDRYRPPYGRIVEERPRQCVFFGSTNTFEFLVDPTGNRRFWPFRCVNPPAKRLDELEVDQIWAEAVVYYRQGFPTYLDKQADAETLAWITERQAEHTEESTLTGAIREYLDTPLPDNWAEMDIYQRRAYLEEEFSGERSGRPRDTVSVVEVWVELLGRDKASLDKKSSREIASIIENTPGWRRAGKRRLPLYGQQRVFERIQKFYGTK